jgi:hypothetical protein
MYRAGGSGSRRPDGLLDRVVAEARLQAQGSPWWSCETRDSVTPKTSRRVGRVGVLDGVERRDLVARASESAHSSSGATTEEFEICTRAAWKSSTDISSASAISASVGPGEARARGAR